MPPQSPISPSTSNRNPDLNLPTSLPLLCYHPDSLRSFLRQSRAVTDDPISQQLSAFAANVHQRPQEQGTKFSSSTSSTTARTPSTHLLPDSTCSSFLQSILLPSWRSRSLLLAQCTTLSQQPDPDDPSATLRAEQARHKAEVVPDERLDPYSARYEVSESRREVLRRVLNEEVNVERIVRERTWEVLRGRCAGGGLDSGWEEASPLDGVEKDAGRGVGMG